jgi:hypothetical protein
MKQLYDASTMFQYGTNSIMLNYVGRPPWPRRLPKSAESNYNSEHNTEYKLIAYDTKHAIMTYLGRPPLLRRPSRSAKPEEISRSKKTSTCFLQMYFSPLSQNYALSERLLCFAYHTYSP